METEPYKYYAIEIYTGDKCCQEFTNIRFKRNHGEWQSLKNLNSYM